MLLSYHLLWDAIISKLSALIFHLMQILVFIYIQLEIWQFSMLSKLGKKPTMKTDQTVKNPNQVAQC